MDVQIALLLGQDGIVNGAVYGLLALAMVLVFSVTRIIFIPQGELVAFAALSMAALNAGRTPAVLWLLIGLAVITLLVETWRQRRGAPVDWRSALTLTVLLPVIAASMVVLRPASVALQALATLLVVAPLGPLLYRLAYRPIASASVLMLLIVSVALHGVMVGLGLLFFGAEGYRTPPFWDERFSVGALSLSGQTLIVFGVTIALMALLFVFFDRSLHGKALRATAVNRAGARLMGISTDGAGRLSFTMAAFIGALSGLLIGPTTTVFYDTGFLVGLKGFVAAVFAGLASFPAAFAGALAVGVLESFGSFWASAFKEVIVFTAILPVLLWRSFTDRHGEDH